MKVSEVVEAVERGQIPVPLAEKTEWLGVLTTYSRKLPQVSAAVIAAARRENFPGEDMALIQEWQRWAEESFEFSRGHVQHCNAAGKLLLDFMGKPESETLFRTEFNKLVSLARLPRAGVSKFLEEHDVLAMPRDALRAEVAIRLGERPQPQEDDDGEPEMVQPELDLWGAVDTLCRIDNQAFDNLGGQITDSKRAVKVFYAGLGLVDTGLKFAESNDLDPVALRQVGLTLVNQRKALVKVMRRVDPDFEAEG